MSFSIICGSIVAFLTIDSVFIADKFNILNILSDLDENAKLDKIFSY